MEQEKVFISGEGNNWFRRNRDYVTGSHFVERDQVLSLMRMFKLAPRKVLEVGASNGFRLAEIARQYNAEGYGIEPSAEAVKDGQVRFPFLHLSQGLASSMPFKDEEFDLVVVNYVLHWIDREKLLKSVAEIDRVLQWNGYLVLGDFFPLSPGKTRYHHLPNDDVWTYKQDYSQLFTASNLYQLVGNIIGSHSGQKVGADIPSEDRTVVFLMQKKADYPEMGRESKLG